MDALARGGPCVVCSLHLGNWEVVACAGKRMGVQFTGVYQRISNPYVDAETHKMRAFLYEGGLLPKTPVTARSLLRAARNGGYPAFLADLRDDRGASVPFFGHPARSNVFPALLARTTGLPLYAGAAYRLPHVRFRIKVGARADPEDRRPRRRRGRRDRGAPGPVRDLRPRGARAMDVGPPQVGLAIPLTGTAWTGVHKFVSGSSRKMSYLSQARKERVISAPLWRTMFFRPFTLLGPFPCQANRFPKPCPICCRNSAGRVNDPLSPGLRKDIDSFRLFCRSMTPRCAWRLSNWRRPWRGRAPISAAASRFPEQWMWGRRRRLRRSSAAFPASMRTPSLAR